MKRTLTVTERGYKALLARQALKDMGVKATAFDRALRMVDLDAIAVSDDGEVTGMADQMVDLKRDFEILFEENSSSNGDERSGSGHGTPTQLDKSEEDTRSTSERQADGLLGHDSRIGRGPARPDSSVAQAAAILRGAGRREEAARLLERHGGAANGT